MLTAFYGGAGVKWPARRKKLLRELDRTGSDDRRARFVCALHFIDEDGREFATMGTVDGTIPPEERGSDGFSFDPIFFYPPANRTFAELTAEEKNRISHRAIAAAALLAGIKTAAN